MMRRGFLKTVVVVAFIAFFFKGELFHELAQKLYVLERNITGFSVLSNARDYETLKARGCTVYYTHADSEYAPFIARTAELFLPALLRDFEMPESTEAAIIVYPEAERMRSVAGTGNGLPPMGLYYGGVIHVLSPRLWAGGEQAERIDRFLSEGPVAHELAHYLLDLKANGNFDVWFTEGVALYYEYKYTGAQWREDLDGLGNGVSMDELAESFGAMDSAVAYRRAFEAVNGMVEEKGEGALRRIVRKLAEGKSFKTAYNEVFSGSLAR